ncbi:MAG TPA: glycosyltransferase [Armatimonadota bacterium]|jgi:glycosyltransferase involved in cell wall biosynthesis
MQTARRESPRAAVVHDFFVTDGGADACAVEFAGLLPDASVFTSFFHAGRFGHQIDPRRVRTWPIQRFTGPTDHFRGFLPLYPVWYSALDLRAFDLVVSSSIAFAHAVRTRKGALHATYVHTPMRYAWDLDAYLEKSSLSLTSRLAARTIRPLLQRWDVATAGRPDVVVANSGAVRDRIRRLWGREAEVIHPPVDVGSIPLSTRDDGYLLVAARMLAYRRLDLAVDAATRLRRDLVIVGDGPERLRLEARGGPTVRFTGRVDRSELVDLFARCHAYLVPGVEDFGIAPVEAMAAGKPVIALRAGGPRESVLENVTGVFFERQTVDDLVDAIERLDDLTFQPTLIRAHAATFDTSVFLRRWRELFARHDVDPTLYAPEGLTT